MPGEPILIAQRYIVVILLIAAFFLWQKVKQTGIEEFFKNPRIIQIILLLALPFIYVALPSLSDNIRNLGESISLAGIALIGFILFYRDFQERDIKRDTELEELLEQPKHPIALEFARKMVLPQIETIKKEEKRIHHFEKKVTSRLKEKEEEVESKVKETNQRLTKVENEEQRIKD